MWKSYIDNKTATKQQQQQKCVKKWNLLDAHEQHEIAQ